MAMERRRGFLLVEAIAALSVLVIGFVGVATLLARSLSFYHLVADTFTANYLAMEGIEVVKNLVDADVIQGCSWNEVKSGTYEVSYGMVGGTGQCPGAALVSTTNTDFLTRDPRSGLYGYGYSTVTQFTRVVTIVTSLRGDADAVQVNSRVAWTAQGQSREVNVEDVFRNWRP